MRKMYPLFNSVLADKSRCLKVFAAISVFLLGITPASRIFSQTTTTFTTSGTWVCPAGVTSISVECWGAGGGGGYGGSSNKNGGGGGGGGAYTKNAAVSVISGTTYTITVGTGGTGGTSSSINGQSGSASTAIFGVTTVTANPGQGGAGFANGGTGGAGGAAGTFSGGSGATQNSSGSGGGGGGAGSTGNGGTASGQTAGTGTSVGGGGGGAGSATNSGNGGSGSVYGGGGGGATRSGTPGSGANGQITITYTCIIYSLTSAAATNVCQGSASTVTLSGLPNGTYTVTYNLTGTNTATGSTASMTVSGGVGFFTTSALANSGATTITITSLVSGSGASCNSPISSNNSASIFVGATISGTLSVCSGLTTQLTGSGTPDATTPWSSATTTVATINSTGLITGISAGTSVITYKNSNGCTTTATVTVNQTPSVTTAQIATSCGGSGFTVTPTNGGGNTVPAGTTYSWDLPAVTGGMTGGATGTNASSITGTLINPTNTTQTATYTVTPTSGSCVGNTFTVTVTVNPKATITNQTATICSSTAFTVTPVDGVSGNVIPAGTTYTWTAPVSSPAGAITGGTAQGTGQSSISQTLTNTTNASATLTYTVTSTSGSCVGSTFTVTVTVNPKPSVANQTATICSRGTFTVTPANGGGNIVPAGTTYTWAAPVSSTLGAITGGGAEATGQSSISQTLTNTTNASATLTYTVTPTSGSCAGNTFTVTVTVNPKATVTNQTATICSGTAFTVTPVDGVGGNIIPSGTTYTWTAPVSSPAGALTGGSAQGTGQSSISQTLTNSTNASATLTYTVTPTSGTCAGNTFTVTVTVNPKPAVTTANTASTCNGGSPNINLTASVPSSFSWTIGTITGSIIGASAGSGSTINQILTNPSNATAGTVQYLVTPTSITGTCTGAPYTITVTVNPTPVVTTVATKSICSGTGTGISLTASTASTFSWTIGTITGGITGASAGSGSTVNQTLINPSSTTAGTVEYIVTPTSTAGTCTGAPYTITVTVNPSPVVTTANTATTCSGTGPNISLTASVASTFSWTIGTITGGITGAAAGSGNTINQTLTNPGNTTAGSVQYIVTPTATTGSCAGAPYTITVTVNPKPVVTTANTANVCSGGSPNISLTASVAGTFSWTIGTITGGITGASAGSGSTIDQILTNPSNTTPGTIEYIVTPTSTTGTCTGTPYTITVTVNAPPIIATNATDYTVCATFPASFTVSATGSNLTYQWYKGTYPSGTQLVNTANISGVTTNTLNFDQAQPSDDGDYYVVVSGVTCSDAVSAKVHLTVNYQVNIITQPVSQTLCIGDPLTFSVSATGTIASYQWFKGGVYYADATDNGGGNYTLSIPAVAPSDAGSYQLVLDDGTATGCPIAKSNFVTLTVNPTPTVNAVPGQTVCNGNNTTVVNFSGAVAGTVYNWTNDNTSIGLAANGSGNIPAFSATNTGNAPVSATITVTPAYTNGGTTCYGTPVSFTITVNPTSTVNIVSNQTVCNGSSTTAISFGGSVSGTVYNWTNNTPGIGLPASGSGDIAAFTAVNSGVAVITATITVTPVANTCPGTPTTFTITVNPTPTVNAVSDQTICNGGNTTAVNFTGAVTGTVYNWSNDNTSINLAASGTGNIPIFAAINSGATAVTATITVTPSYTNGITTCTGISKSFTITVNSTPTVNAVANQTLCNGSPTTAVNFTGAVGGTVYNWTNNNATIGLAASGTGDIPSFTATNGGTTNKTATITVTPSYTNAGKTCSGAQVTFTINVNVNPIANAGPDKSTNCSLAPVMLGATAPSAGTGMWTIVSGAGGTVTTPTSPTSTFTSTAVDMTVYKLVWTVSNSPCATIATDTMLVTVIPPITGNSLALLSVCRDAVTGGVSPLMGTNPAGVLSGGNGIYTYSWTRKCNGTGTVALPDTTATIIVPQGATNCFYSRTVVSAGCPSTSPGSGADGHINTNNLPTTTTLVTPTTGSASYCKGGPGIKIGTTSSVEPVTATSTTPGYSASYELFLNGISTGLILTGTGGPLDFNYQTAVGTYTVKETITVSTGSQGCGATIFPNSFTITAVDSNVTASIRSLNPQTVCATATIAGNKPAYGTGLWTVVSGAGTFANATDSITTVSNMTLISPYTNVFKWKVTNGACADSANTTVTAHQPTVAPTGLNASPPAICKGAGTPVTLTQTGGTLGTSAQWQWYSDPGFSTKVGVLISTPNASITVSPTITTTYYLRAEAPVCGNTAMGSVTVTVNPTPTIAAKTQTVCSGSSFSVMPVNGTDIVPGGTTYTWSVPTVTGGMTGGAAGTNQASITGTLTNPTNIVQTATYTVTPTSGSCTGSSFTVTINVNPKPSIINQTSITCSGTGFNVVPANGGGNIVPAGTTYTWSAPTATGGISGGAAGTDQASIAGTLTNPTNTAQTATYTVTPTSGSCTGSAFTVTVTVNPTPTIAAQTQTICSGGSFGVTPVNGTDIVPGSTTYTWSVPTVTGGMTGGAAGTNQASIAGTLTNPTNIVQTATYTVTPTSGSCTGSSFTVTITVNPKPSIINQTSITCSGTGFNVVPANGGGNIVPAGTTYTWSAPIVTGGITGGAAGTDQASITGTLSNPTNTAQTATYTVTPTSGSCAGSTFTVTVTVNPTPTIAAQTQTICSGGSFGVTPVNGTDIVPGGTTYTWSVPTVTGGMTGGAAGTNQASITGTLTNPTNIVQTATYTVTPNSGCTGSPFMVVITVNAPPAITAQPSLIPGCLFDGVNVSVGGSGTSLSYNWQISPDGGMSWNNLSDSAVFSNTNTQTVNISATNLGMLPYQFRVNLIGAAPCGSIQSDPIAMQFVNQWVGGSSTSWNTNTNWVNNTLPDFNSCSWVVIPANVSLFPMLNSSITVPNIAMANGANLDLNDQVLTVTGTFLGTGKLKGSAASGLEISTSGDAGTVYFDTTVAYNKLKTLTINSGASLKLGDDGIGSPDTLSIVAGTAGTGYGTVTATGTLDANGVLTLKSDVNGTARVGISTGSITGNVTVERYIPGWRAWRFLTVPFSSSGQKVRDAWQEGVNNFGLDYNTFNKNPHPGYGTHITGNNNSNLGWDFNTTQNPSYKVWNSAGTGFDAVEPPTISTTITSFKAYCIFVRGSRAVNLSLGTSAPVDPTVLRATGILNQTGFTAPKTYNVTTAGQFVFIGNPYASTIDLHDVLQKRSSGIDTTKLWVWDPKIVGTGVDNVGGYVSYSSGTIVPASSPSYPDVASVFRIQSGQGFMLQLKAASTAATLNYQESDKITSETNVFGLRAQTAAASTSYPVIYTNLMLRKGDQTAMIDGVGAGFSKRFSSAIDDNDAGKLWNFDENIALARDGRALAIELRQPPVYTDTLFYNLSLKQKHYALKIFAANLAPGSSPEAWLVDRYLNKKIVANLLDTTVYNFEPTSDSIRDNSRFMLVFRNIKENVTGEENNTADMARIEAEGKVVLYPNPVSTNKVTLQFSNMDKGNYEVTIYSSKGQKLASRKLHHDGGSNAYNLPLHASWSAGVYRISIIQEDSKKAMNLNLVISR